MTAEIILREVSIPPNNEWRQLNSSNIHTALVDIFGLTHCELLIEVYVCDLRNSL